MESRRLLVVAGDVVAISVFGLIGLTSHERAITAESFARSVLPFAAAWLAVGLPLGAASARVSLWRVAGVWLLAGVAALAVRSLVFERPLLSAFFVIGLPGNGLFLMLWRLAYAMATERRGRRSGRRLQPKQSGELSRL
jgi:hypothetical protein